MGSVTLQDNYGRVGGYLNRNDREIFTDGAVGLDAPVVAKVVTTVTLPWELNTSLFYRFTSGMNANNFSNDMARVVQVRDVTTGTLYPIRVEENGSFRQDDVQIFDARVSRMFRLGVTRLEAVVDGFNLFNANNILSTGVITGSNLGVPLRIVTGRVFRLGVKVDF
jgi:hypothetical protein